MMKEINECVNAKRADGEDRNEVETLLNNPVLSFFLVLFLFLIIKTRVNAMDHRDRGTLRDGVGGGGGVGGGWGGVGGGGGFF